MEALEINEAIQELILKGGSEESIYREARKHGFTSMREDAIIKALNHVIPHEEINNYGTKVGEENILEELEAPIDAPPPSTATASDEPPLAEATTQVPESEVAPEALGVDNPDDIKTIDV